jgi:hypothetical protein
MIASKLRLKGLILMPCYCMCLYLLGDAVVNGLELDSNDDENKVDY